MQISLKGDLKALTKGFSDLRKRQIPFAAAQAVTAVARKVAQAETEQLSKTFTKPTPFTQHAFRVRGASKSNLTATVYALDKQAAYLASYLNGGLQFLGSKQAILTPVKIPLNAYGNIPKGKLQSLKGQADFFIGEIHGIYGLWQRMKPPSSGAKRRRGFIVQKPHLRLLIDFTKPRPVTQRLPYDQVATKVISSSFQHEFEAAFARAMATAK
jgi:hypothetical protein